MPVRCLLDQLATSGEAMSPYDYLAPCLIAQLLSSVICALGTLYVAHGTKAGESKTRARVQHPICSKEATVAETTLHKKYRWHYQICIRRMRVSARSVVTPVGHTGACCLLARGQACTVGCPASLGEREKASYAGNGKQTRHTQKRQHKKVFMDILVYICLLTLQPNQ